MKQEFNYKIKNLLRDVITDVHTVVPGKIIHFDPDKCEAEVEPIAYFRKPDDSLLKYPNIHEVPVVFPQAAGQTVTFAWLIQPGDYCHIYFSEQALDTWRTGAESGTDLRFDLTNAFAIVGFFPTPNPHVRRAYDNESIIIQREETFIEVYDGKLEMLVKNKDVGKNAYHLMVDGITSDAELSVNDLSKDSESINIAINGNDGTIKLLTTNTEEDTQTIEAEIDGQNGTMSLKTKNVEMDKIVVDYKFDGQEGDINASVTNYDTGITTIQLDVDGQNGTVSLTTFDKGSGAVTGILTVP
jgi:hypothetical protein